MDSEFKVGMAVGAFLAALASLVIGLAILDTMLDECEKELPRTQHCKLIAVPK